MTEYFINGERLKPETIYMTSTLDGRYAIYATNKDGKPVMVWTGDKPDGYVFSVVLEAARGRLSTRESLPDGISIAERWYICAVCSDRIEPRAAKRCRDCGACLCADCYVAGGGYCEEHKVNP